jgi:two-component system, cell cycle response regulator CpdR
VYTLHPVTDGLRQTARPGNCPATTLRAKVIMIRILLAEDEEAMRTYLARALENAGYEVVAVDRGTDAVPLLETQHFDLLLSDIVMPEMDGIELAQRCAQISPATKVMFITGFAAVTLKANREAPTARVLSKPFHLRDLVMEVERVFAESPLAGNGGPLR